MRILWIKLGGVWPLDVGGRLRSFHLLSELSQRHAITLLTTHQPGEDSHEAARHLPHCERVISFPFAAPKIRSVRFIASLARSWFSSLPVDLWKWRVPALRAEADRILCANDVDLCVADFLHAIPNLPKNCSVPVLFFAHNVESMIWKRLQENESRAWRRALLAIESKKMARQEHRACSRSRIVVAVSDVDAACLSSAARFIPTGVDTDYFTANGTPRRDAHLVFTGAMDWYPNEDAMFFFIHEILPLIRQQVPALTVTVAGRKPSARLRAVADAAGVFLTGSVTDIRPFMDEAAVYIVPLRIGGGTRLKIFEALSMGKAVVSTTIGAEGLPLVDGKHFLRADSPAQFSQAVVSLLRDLDRRRLLGREGESFVRAHYSWRSVAREFEAKCEEALIL